MRPGFAGQGAESSGGAKHQREVSSVKRILLLLGCFAIVGALTLGLTTLAGARVLKSSKSDATVPAFSAKDLTALPGADSIAPHGDDFGQAHSSLAEVNPGNVTNLKLAWHAVLDAPNVADPPVEHG